MIRPYAHLTLDELIAAALDAERMLSDWLLIDTQRATRRRLCCLNREIARR